MGTVDLKEGPSAVAINMMLIVRPEQKGQRDRQTDSAGKTPREGRAAGVAPAACWGQAAAWE